VRRIIVVLSVLAALLVAAPAASACITQTRSVYVQLSMSDYPGTTDHILDAIDAGQPSLLHIDRVHADQHREESLAGIPTKSGYDRDEYPPAASEEGGFGADVRYVELSDNRGAGSSMGHQLSDFCNGQPYRFDIVP
jgi:hypothetical protein